MDSLKLKTPHKIVIKTIHFINFMILSKRYIYLTCHRVKKVVTNFF